jgi:hypothetical protein
MISSPREAQFRASLVSVRRANLTGLALSNVGLQKCLFAGVHNLDRLRIESPRPFAETPRGTKLGRLGGQGLPVWRWTRRQTLVEEHQWRASRRMGTNWSNREPSPAHSRVYQLVPYSPNHRDPKPHPKKAGWYPPDCRPSSSEGSHVSILYPEEISSLYRALRKGREDNKDEPGAADFYYGEMEMRRNAKSSPVGERLVLLLYWLVAGYGQRASRALFGFLIVLLSSSALIAAIGLPSASGSSVAVTGTVTGTPPAQTVQLTYPRQDPQNEEYTSFPRRFSTAWWISLEAALFRSPDRALTPAGQHVQTAVRFLGPIFLALAILSIRGRVKR